MAKGDKTKKKKSNSRTIISRELKQRVKEFSSAPAPNTKKDIEAALAILRASIKNGKKEYDPRNSTYKKARPESYNLTIKRLEKRLKTFNQQEQASVEENLRASEEEKIKISKKAEFFIALGKKKIHSFVMLGYMQDGQPQLLAKIGKSNQIDKDFDSPGRIIRKALFSTTEAQLQQESLRPRGKLSYLAYSISYEQYLQFIKLVALAQREQDIKCYQPIEEEGEQVNMAIQLLPRTSLEVVNAEVKAFIKRSHSLEVANTCRHTAIELIEYTQGIRHPNDTISRSFFRSLPLSSEFSYGRPNRHFYIFPQPPSAYEAEKEKRLMLIKIYERMENLLKKDTYSEQTIQKFEALKELYNKQAGIPSGNIEEALDCIQKWKLEKKALIGQLRGSFLGKLFVSRSATEAMAEEIEKSLRNKNI